VKEIGTVDTLHKEVKPPLSYTCTKRLVRGSSIIDQLNPSSIGATSVTIGVGAGNFHLRHRERHVVSGRKTQAWGYRPSGSTSSTYPQPLIQPEEVAECVSASKVIPGTSSLDPLPQAVARHC
jgi:hypothetical protein